MDKNQEAKLWEAVNAYARSCGGDPDFGIGSPDRMKAVVTIETAVADIIAGVAKTIGKEIEEKLDDMVKTPLIPLETLKKIAAQDDIVAAIAADRGVTPKYDWVQVIDGKPVAAFTNDDLVAGTTMTAGQMSQADRDRLGIFPAATVNVGT